MRVVIVDDSAKIRNDLKMLVGRLGWEVVGEGETGIEAIELVEKLKPDLLTLDIIMPEMDGIECYRQLRQKKASCKCIIVSVLASEPRVLQAFEKEIYTTHFLKKPIVERDFRDRVEEILKMEPFPRPPVEISETAPSDVSTSQVQ